MTLPYTLANGPGNPPDAVKLMANFNALDSLGYGEPTAWGMRNRIINGDMRIDQRNSGAAVTQTTGDVFPADRWRINGSVTSKFTGRQRPNILTINDSGLRSALEIVSLSNYSVGAGEYFTLSQHIEGFNTSDFNFGNALAKTITLSFWVSAGFTGTLGGSVQNSANNRSYPFTYTINATNTWEKKTITIPGDTSGTWLGEENGVGLRLWIGLGCGSTYSGTAGAWATADYRSATGALSVVGTNGATIYFTGVQLEKGSTATPFELLEIGKELNLCRRYYESGGISFRSGNRASGTAQTVPVFYKATKRAAPTVTIGASPYTTDNWGTYAVGSHNNPAGANDTTSFANIEVTATGAVPAGGVIACLWTSTAEY